MYSLKGRPDTREIRLSGGLVCWLLFLAMDAWLTGGLDWREVRGAAVQSMTRTYFRPSWKNVARYKQSNGKIFKYTIDTNLLLLRNY